MTLRTSHLSMVLGLGVAYLVGVNAALAGNCGSAKTASARQSSDIVDTAVAAGNFQTLVKAVQAAGLVETLKSDGPFTVFAPTDAAFAKLPAGTVKSLLQNKDRLQAILLYHVVPGRLMAADVVKRSSAKTALGQTASISTASGAMIDNARITATDIETSNGVIHVIDTVILPKNDIIEAARGAGSFTTLLTAIEAAGLTDALRSAGPFTVFAPTDEAFGKLPAGTVDALLKDTTKLKSILTYHVVPARVTSQEVTGLSEAKTLQGGKIRIDTGDGVKINDAVVLKADVEATNGVIHVIDTVILPEA